MPKRILVAFPDELIDVIHGVVIKRMSFPPASSHDIQ